MRHGLEFTYFTILVDCNGGGVKHLLVFLHRSASFVAKNRIKVLIFPAESARTEDPGLNIKRGVALRGIQTRERRIVWQRL